MSSLPAQFLGISGASGNRLVSKADFLGKEVAAVKSFVDGAARASEIMGNKIATCIISHISCGIRV